MKKRKNNYFLLSFISFVIFIVAAGFITFPLVFNINRLTTGTGDELVIAWIQNWVIYSLQSGNILSIFDANLYFPYRNTFAFSETFITSSILAFPIRLLFADPIVTTNFTFISSLIFLSFSVYLLCFYLTKNFLTSIFAGILIMFSPAVLDKKVHLQILTLEFIPLAILFFLLFIKLQKSRFLALSMFFFLLQTYNSFMPGYFVVFSLGIIFIFNLIYNKNKTKKLITKKNILLILFPILLLLPIVIPYYQVSKEFNYARDIRDAVHLALQPEDLLYSSDHSRLYTFLNDLPFNQQSQNGEFKPGYLGFIFTVLVILVLWRFIKYFKKNGFLFNAFVSIGLLGFILSLGPALHLGRQTVHIPFPIPLPYALFYYVMPGFQGFRNSARWEMLFVIAIAVAIAMVLHQLLKKYPLKKQIIIYCILIAGCITEFNFPMEFKQIPQVKDFPKVDYWLATTPQDSRIIHLPIYNWYMWPYTQNELWREYYSTLHFRKMVNGYTGFSPPPWQDLVVEMMTEFPSEKSINTLKNIGITYVIIHKDEYDLLYRNKQKIGDKPISNGEIILKKLDDQKELNLIKTFDADYIYSF